MTRAVVVGPVATWSTADVYRGWCRGLTEVGVEVVRMDLSDRLRFLADAEVIEDGRSVKSLSLAEATKLATFDLLGFTYRYRPDVVIVVHGANLYWPTLAELRCPLVLVMTESPYEDDGQALMAQVAEPDLILLNDPTHQAVFAQIAPTYYVPHAYDPTVHHPGSSTISADCCFVGTGFPNRVEWMERVDWTGIDLTLGGQWAGLAEGSPLRRFVRHDDLAACVDNDTTADIYRGSATAFNVYRYSIHGEHSTGDGWAIGPREVELAACGTWFARQSRPEGDDLFPMLPTFDSPEELGDLIRWALAHPTERHTAALKAQEAVSDRTFASHAVRALTRLGIDP